MSATHLILFQRQVLLSYHLSKRLLNCHRHTLHILESRGFKRHRFPRRPAEHGATLDEIQRFFWEKLESLRNLVRISSKRWRCARNGVSHRGEMDASCEGYVGACEVGVPHSGA